MLFCGRKLTAQEACSRGLVSQVFWPTTFNQEVMLRVKEMASCSAVVGPGLLTDECSQVRPSDPPPSFSLCVWKVLEESKCLVRSIVMSVLEEVNEKECQMLKQLCCSTKGLEALFSYLHKSCDKWSEREADDLRLPLSAGWTSLCSSLSSFAWVCVKKKNIYLTPMCPDVYFCDSSVHGWRWDTELICGKQSECTVASNLSFLTRGKLWVIYKYIFIWTCKKRKWAFSAERWGYRQVSTLLWVFAVTLISLHLGVDGRQQITYVHVDTHTLHSHTHMNWQHVCIVPVSK